MMSAERERPRWRKRRLIYNNDGDDVLEARSVMIAGANSGLPVLDGRMWILGGGYIGRAEPCSTCCGAIWKSSRD